MFSKTKLHNSVYYSYVIKTRDSLILSLPMTYPELISSCQLKLYLINSKGYLDVTLRCEQKIFKILHESGLKISLIQLVFSIYTIKTSCLILSSSTI